MQFTVSKGTHRTYALTVDAKYAVYLSGIIVTFFDNFSAMPAAGYAYTTDQKMIEKRLK
ncbi:hypothetical protein JMG10_46155 [Nostoc ellipsosporum NOK]|nr:hypothetical protein [Nostoc ellipsosporum NOK]